MQLFVDYLKLFVVFKIIGIIGGLFVEKCSVFSSRLFEIICNDGLSALFEIILNYCKLFADYYFFGLFVYYLNVIFENLFSFLPLIL